jgi:5'-3' exonuclease
MIFAAVSQCERNGELPRIKKGEKYDMKDIKPFFLHLLFTSLKNIKENFSIKANEDIVLCLDSSSWRKDYYSGYKSNRSTSRDESNIVWKDFYEVADEAIDILNKAFPFTVIKTPKAEGDDVMAVLTKHYHKNERTLLITEDKDFKQLLEYKNVQIYRPIRKEYIKMTQEELVQWRIEHVLLGDKVDGIPTIKDCSIFSPEFIKYLKENNIHNINTTDVYEFNKLHNAQYLLDCYEGVDKKGNNNTYKAPAFGEKTAQAFVKDGLLQNLRSNKIFRDNFRRNRVLVQFKFIPIEVEQAILDDYKLCYNTNSNHILIQEYFRNNNLKQLANSVDSFCDITQQNEASFDDWF